MGVELINAQLCSLWHWYTKLRSQNEETVPSG